MADETHSGSEAPALHPMAGASRLALERVFRTERAKILAALIRTTRDFALAEDVLQEAMAEALDKWPHAGLPQNPSAWIQTTARRRAIDRVRRAQRFREKAVVLAQLQGDADSSDAVPLEPMDDDLLRLLFTCCHPALPLEARVALTLKTIGGLTTPEIAKAFLIDERALAQRIVRAKRKIRIAGIPYRVPESADLPERVQGVLHVIYLIFNEGYYASGGEQLVRSDLCNEGVRLARLVHELMPDNSEVMGLLALLLLTDARRPARLGGSGALVTLEKQDRSLWDADGIRVGRRLLHEALELGRPGPYQIQAAIAAVHAQAPVSSLTDWREIVALYDLLLVDLPTPVVAVNRAVAVAMVEGPKAGLKLLDELDARRELRDYGPYHAARADLLRRADRWSDAILAYQRALALTANQVERDYLNQRLDLLRSKPSSAP